MTINELDKKRHLRTYLSQIGFSASKELSKSEFFDVYSNAIFEKEGITDKCYNMIMGVIRNGSDKNGNLSRADIAVINELLLIWNEGAKDTDYVDVAALEKRIGTVARDLPKNEKNYLDDAIKRFDETIDGMKQTQVLKPELEYTSYIESIEEIKNELAVKTTVTRTASAKVAYDAIFQELDQIDSLVVAKFKMNSPVYLNSLKKSVDEWTNLSKVSTPEKDQTVELVLHNTKLLSTHQLSKEMYLLDDSISIVKSFKDRAEEPTLEYKNRIKELNTQMASIKKRMLAGEDANELLPLAQEIKQELNENQMYLNQATMQTQSYVKAVSLFVRLLKSIKLAFKAPTISSEMKLQYLKEINVKAIVDSLSSMDAHSVTFVDKISSLRDELKESIDKANIGCSVIAEEFQRTIELDDEAIDIRLQDEKQYIQDSEVKVDAQAELLKILGMTSEDVQNELSDEKTEEEKQKELEKLLNM